ncbi:hypothetical protein ACWD4G_38100 [Streptomyces sp. NPDC002643]
MSAAAIRITRGPGGEVEVDGPVDTFAASVLARAGFDTYPMLRGVWIRMPFDRGHRWENEHATWAAEMLTAARYRVDLAPDLRPTPGDASGPPRRAKTAMTTHPSHADTARRPRH